VEDVKSLLEKIDAEASKKKLAIADKIKSAMDEKKKEIRQLESEYDALAASYADATGRAVRKATGGERSKRMGKEEKAASVAALPAIMKGKTLSAAEICSALGVEKSSWQTIRKAAGAALKQIGEKRDAKYSWVG